MVQAELTRKHYKDWQTKELPIGFAEMPDQPKRKEELEIKDPGRIKRGRGGTLVCNLYIFLMFFFIQSSLW